MIAEQPCQEQQLWEDVLDRLREQPTALPPFDGLERLWLYISREGLETYSETVATLGIWQAW